jgi:hypothetical protein
LTALESLKAISEVVVRVRASSEDRSAVAGSEIPCGSTILNSIEQL